MEYMLIIFEDIEMWIELTEEGYALRQIIKEEDNTYHLSCVEDCLAEGVIKKEDLAGDIISIKKTEFEYQWDELKKAYVDKWIETKRNYIIGKKIKGKFQYYYPQGYIFDINGVLGLLKDDTGMQAENLCIGDIVEGVVIGYDDINMWILISLIK